MPGDFIDSLSSLALFGNTLTLKKDYCADGCCICTWPWINGFHQILGLASIVPWGF